MRLPHLTLAFLADVLLSVPGCGPKNENPITALTEIINVLHRQHAKEVECRQALQKRLNAMTKSSRERMERDFEPWKMVKDKSLLEDNALPEIFGIIEEWEQREAWEREHPNEK